MPKAVRIAMIERIGAQGVVRFLSIGLAVVALAAAAETQSVSQPVVANQSRARPVVMERSIQWTLRSKVGRVFEVSVALPQESAPASGYPVMYVLDPQTSFATLTETTRNHEAMFGPTVVVGVGYPSEEEARNRTLDLTPSSTDPAKLPAMYPEGWGAVGGATAFAEFLLGDVRSAVMKQVPIDPHRQALFGHSLGGLFVLHMLFTEPDSFDTYVAASPSIWWSNKTILSELPRFESWLASHDVRPRLLVSVGGLEDRMNPEELRLIEKLKMRGASEMAELFDMVGNARRLATRLGEFRQVDLEFVEFTSETHNSVIPAYLGRGSRFALSRWYP